VIVCLVVIAGLVGTFLAWVVSDNGSLAIVIFSFCYLVVFLAVLFTALSKQFHSTGLHRYYTTRVRRVVGFGGRISVLTRRACC